MKNKVKQKIDGISIGKKLLEARKLLSLSREKVSEALCLKVSIIRKIEKGIDFNKFNSTFIRGYIRSYAKLVKVPESEILDMLNKYTPIKPVNLNSLQNYSLGEVQKKRRNIFRKFFFVTLVVILTFVGIILSKIINFR